MQQNASQEGAQKPRRWTLVLLAVGGVFLAAGLVVGVADNPPGLVLVYLAVTAWIAAFAHRWRRAKRFLVLLVASLVAFPLSVVLHNVFYALASVASNVVGLSQLLVVLEVVFFLIAVLVCPPGALIGAAGSVVLAISRFRRDRSSSEGS
jgi:hypothetical protein